MSKFEHRSANLKDDRKFIYTAMSKHLFYFRSQISKFVIDEGGVPLNPFMIFDYFLCDCVERDEVRSCNNNLIRRSDEIWVFGTVSDGVFAEILLAREKGKVVRYFKVEKSKKIISILKEKVEFEEDVIEFYDKI